MNMQKRYWAACILVLAGMTVAAKGVHAQQAPAQAPSQPAPKKEQPAAAINRLTVEVVGGESNKPIENASVYVKTIEQRLIKDKKLEVNVKTNQKGVARIPEPPMGRVLIQIVAEGWKTYGHWYDITESNQVITIHLERPPKWY
jgi:hypothetical protein